MYYLSIICALSVLFAGAACAQSVKQEQRFLHDGENRLYYLNLPENLPENAPLIVALHGMGGQAHKMRYGLGLHDLANEMEFATLFPQGSKFGENTSYWNAGNGPGADDDLGFLSRLITHVSQSHNLDPERVYVLGISNGGQMAYHLACHHPELIAGIAVVIGMITSDDWSNCHPEKAVSLLHIHGTADPVYDFGGGVAWNSGGRYPAAPDLVARWARDADATPVPAPAAPVAHSTITRYETAQGLPVELVAIRGFGHDWPHPKNVGFSAARFISEFFMTQSVNRPDP